MTETYSVFDHRNIKDVYQEIQDLYLQQKRPWVISYSGGKDSSTALQLVWKAIETLPEDERRYPVYVIASDTKVETPIIVNYIDTTLKRINETAKASNMPFQAEKVMPTLNDTFWVNLIGRGYPAPTTQFRWCTDRMKINPANRFIERKVSEHGEVIMVLGVRKAESSTREQLMNTYQVKGHVLRRHTSLRGAFVYAPIADFTADDVWTYLLQVPSPWGNNNRDLAAMYRNANAGECPLVREFNRKGLEMFDEGLRKRPNAGHPGALNKDQKGVLVNYLGEAKEKVSLEEICAFIQKEFGVEISKSTARRYREGFKDWQLPPPPEPETQIIDVPTTPEKKPPPEKPVTAKESDKRLQPEVRTPLQESESATSSLLPEPKPPVESPTRADTKKRATKAVSEKERIRRQQPTLFEVLTDDQT